MQSQKVKQFLVLIYKIFSEVTLPMSFSKGFPVSSLGGKLVILEGEIEKRFWGPI